MKKMLFILLLFSATMPLKVQGTSFNWNPWRNRAVEVNKDETTSWFPTNGRKAFVFLTKSSMIMSSSSMPKSSIAGVSVRSVILNMLSCFFWEKYSPERGFKFFMMGYIITAGILLTIIEIVLDWRDKYFFNAINSNNVAKVKRALQLGSDASLIGELNDGTLVSLLVFSILMNNGEMAKLLVDYGADVNKKDCKNRSALTLSKENDRSEIVKFFVEKNFVYVNEYSDLLMYAAKNGHLDLVKLLHKKNNVDVNWKDEDGNTVLMVAAGTGHNNIVKFLLNNGADINEKNKEGEIALRYAIKNKNGIAEKPRPFDVELSELEANNAEIIELLKKAHQEKTFEDLKKIISESEEEFQHLQGHDLKAIPNIIAGYASDLLLIETEESN